jgi:uncharacterized protein (TIGR02452 family)
MIKRNGVEIMNARSKNVSIAHETLDVCKNKKYTSLNGNVVDISKELDTAVQGTELYNYDLFQDRSLPARKPTIEVTNETTAQAAVRLATQGKTNLVALNFASAKTPGGGFKAGAIAQEEDLCRASGLYPCLKSKPVCYNENILCDDCYYTHNMIYSPKVPFFRDEHNLFIENPFLLSIISAAAPNINSGKEFDQGVLGMKIAHRIDKILCVAEKHGHENLILGAWGCGAFGNNPKMIAQLFKWGLEQVPHFNHVCFAVYDTRTPTHLFDTFTEVMNG